MRRMDIYLPIAGQSVNALLIVVLGFLVGLLSGMFGVGGGFLTTPLLIFYGIPPTVAVASATTQITGASVSGAMVHMRRGGVDLQNGGGDDRRRPCRLARRRRAVPPAPGERPDRCRHRPSLRRLILGWIGALMLKDALIALGYVESQPPPTSAAAAQPLGRLAAAALAVLQLGRLHFAGRAACARLRRRHADRASSASAAASSWSRR